MPETSRRWRMSSVTTINGHAIADIRSASADKASGVIRVNSSSINVRFQPHRSDLIPGVELQTVVRRLHFKISDIPPYVILRKPRLRQMASTLHLAQNPSQRTEQRRGVVK